VNQVVPPVIVELDVRGDRRLLERVLRSTATVAAVPGLMVLAVFVSAGSPVMRLLYGPYYAAGGAILGALSVGQAVNLLTGSCGFTLIMTGRQDIVMMISLVSGAVAVVSAITAVHLGGPLAVAWALSLVFSAHQLAVLFAARKLCGVWTHVDFARLAPELKRLWGQWSKP
jgi:O-antigen/teichoic acid export membrane protein